MDRGPSTVARSSAGLARLGEAHTEGMARVEERL